MVTENSQNFVDIHVGRKVLELRKKMGLSQTEIGKIIGVTYQQIQKYENGLSRVGIDKINTLSKRFKIPVSYFFAEQTQTSPALSSAELGGEEITELLSLFLKFKDNETRQKLIRKARSLLSQQDKYFIKSIKS